MKRNLFGKGLVVGIIVLFVGIGVLSNVSSKEISVSKDIIKEDNAETPLWDEYDEKFAVIRGTGHFTDYEEWYGGYFGPVGIVINLSFSGGTFHILAFTKNPSKPIYKVEANKLTIKKFIGSFQIPSYYFGFLVGYAFGDIYWE